jgi:ketosteroid isomerase-like protein
MKFILGLVFLLLLSPFAIAGAEEDEAAVTQVMNEYLAAYVSLDAHRTSTHFTEPLMLLSGDSTTVLATRSEVETLFGRIFARLRSLNYGHSEWAPLRVRALGGGVAIASARAIRYKIDGSELEKVGATYLLRNTREGWRISVLTSHPASTALTFD